MYAFIPALHNWFHSKTHLKPYHDIAWCRYAKQMQPPASNSDPKDEIIDNKITPSVLNTSSATSDSDSERELESDKKEKKPTKNLNQKKRIKTTKAPRIGKLLQKKRKTTKQAAEKRSRHQFSGKKPEYRQLKKVKRLDMKSCIKDSAELEKK